MTCSSSGKQSRDILPPRAPVLSSVSPPSAQPKARWPDSSQAGPSITLSTRPASHLSLLFSQKTYSNEIRNNHPAHLIVLKVINIFRGRWLTLNWIMPLLMRPWLGLNLWPVSALSSARHATQICHFLQIGARLHIMVLMIYISIYACLFSLFKI